MFQSTSPTRFDLRFSIAGIPIRVHPLFWVIAILLGSNSNNLLMILVWIVVVFVSILVHELGHAFAFRRFGQPSNILLHFSGGLTIPESLPWGSGYATVSLTPNQHIFVYLAGPFAGFALAALTLAVGTALGGQIILSTLLGFIPFPIVLLPYGSGMLNEVFLTFLWVNVFWGIVNLLPVFPLDGGHVTRYVLIQSDPRNGLRTSLWVSVVTGGLLAVTGLLVMNSIYMAFLFGLLAFQSYQMLQGLSARRY
ncbi:MAG: site-2 protease family protein [Anaerolineales bacterium]|nr:site-2 protease family protein [Anaerolineales bacterium]